MKQKWNVKFFYLDKSFSLDTIEFDGIPPLTYKKEGKIFDLFYSESNNLKLEYMELRNPGVAANLGWQGFNPPKGAMDKVAEEHKLDLEPRCTCGARAVNSEHHSDYCDLYERKL